MGSTDVGRCYWCREWGEELYIPDHMGPMCPDCLDDLLHGIGPPRGGKRARCAEALSKGFKSHTLPGRLAPWEQDSIATLIAEFLCAWWEP